MKKLDKMKERTEAEIQKKILLILRAKGAYAIKNITTTKAGVPDILVCYKGYFLGIEVKTPKGKVSALQLDNLKQIKDAGGIGIVARSSKDVVDLLSTIFN